MVLFGLIQTKRWRREGSLLDKQYSNRIGLRPIQSSSCDVRLSVRVFVPSRLIIDNAQMVSFSAFCRK